MQPQAADLQLDCRRREMLEDWVVVVPTGQGVQGLGRGPHIFWGGLSQLVCMSDHLHATEN